MFTVLLAAASRVTAAGEEVSSGLTGQVTGMVEFLVSRIPAWIAGFVVLILTIFAAKLAKSAVESRMEKQVDEEHQDVMILAGRVTYYATLIFGIFVSLKIAGIDLTTILAAVAFGIGFALRDLIMNFLSGVFILVSRQFTIGDFIKVGDTIGKVMEIQTRATILKAVDGTKVIVPNAELFTSQVVSYTSNPMRRVVIPLYVSYDTDIHFASKVALGVIKKHPKVQKKPSASIVVKDYGDSTIDLAARFWVGSRDGWFKVKSDLMHELWVEFQAAGIVVPYGITHIENEQDTAGYIKEASEKTKRRMEEMKLSKAMQESPSAPVSINVNGNGTSAGTNGSNLLAPVGSGAPVLVAATVPVEPEGAYLDQAEIDGQA